MACNLFDSGAYMAELGSLVAMFCTILSWHAACMRDVDVPTVCSLYVKLGREDHVNVRDTLGNCPCNDIDVL